MKRSFLKYSNYFNDPLVASVIGSTFDVGLNEAYLS